MAERDEPRPTPEDTTVVTGESVASALQAASEAFGPDVEIVKAQLVRHPRLLGIRQREEYRLEVRAPEPQSAAERLLAHLEASESRARRTTTRNDDRRGLPRGSSPVRAARPVGDTDLAALAEAPTSAGFWHGLMAPTVLRVNGDATADGADTTPVTGRTFSEILEKVDLHEIGAERTTILGPEVEALDAVEPEPVDADVVAPTPSAPAPPAPPHGAERDGVIDLSPPPPPPPPPPAPVEAEPEGAIRAIAGPPPPPPPPPPSADNLRIPASPAPAVGAASATSRPASPAQLFDQFDAAADGAAAGDEADLEIRAAMAEPEPADDEEPPAPLAPPDPAERVDPAAVGAPDPAAARGPDDPASTGGGDTSTGGEPEDGGDALFEPPPELLSPPGPGDEWPSRSFSDADIIDLGAHGRTAVRRDPHAPAPPVAASRPADGASVRSWTDTDDPWLSSPRAAGAGEGSTPTGQHGGDVVGEAGGPAHDERAHVEELLPSSLDDLMRPDVRRSDEHVAPDPPDGGPMPSAADPEVGPPDAVADVPVVEQDPAEAPDEVVVAAGPAPEVLEDAAPEDVPSASEEEEAAVDAGSGAGALEDAAPEDVPSASEAEETAVEAAPEVLDAAAGGRPADEAPTGGAPAAAEVVEDVAGDAAIDPAPEAELVDAVDDATADGSPGGGVQPERAAPDGSEDPVGGADANAGAGMADHATVDAAPAPESSDDEGVAAEAPTADPSPDGTTAGLAVDEDADGPDDAGEPPATAVDERSEDPVAPAVPRTSLTAELTAALLRGELGAPPPFAHAPPPSGAHASGPTEPVEVGAATSGDDAVPAPSEATAAADDPPATDPATTPADGAERPVPTSEGEPVRAEPEPPLDIEPPLDVDIDADAEPASQAEAGADGAGEPEQGAEEPMPVPAVVDEVTAASTAESEETVPVETDAGPAEEVGVDLDPASAPVGSDPEPLADDVIVVDPVRGDTAAEVVSVEVVAGEAVPAEDLPAGDGAADGTAAEGTSAEDTAPGTADGVGDGADEDAPDRSVDAVEEVAPSARGGDRTSAPVRPSRVGDVDRLPADAMSSAAEFIEALLGPPPPPPPLGPEGDGAILAEALLEWPGAGDSGEDDGLIMAEALLGDGGATDHGAPVPPAVAEPVAPPPAMPEPAATAGTPSATSATTATSAGPPGRAWSLGSLVQLGVPSAVLRNLSPDAFDTERGSLAAVSAAIAAVVPAPVAAPSVDHPVVTRGFSPEAVVAMLDSGVRGVPPSVIEIDGVVVPATADELARALQRCSSR